MGYGRLSLTEDFHIAYWRQDHKRGYNVKASTFTKYVHKQINYFKEIFQNGHQKWVSFFFNHPVDRVPKQSCKERYREGEGGVDREEDGKTKYLTGQA